MLPIFSGLSFFNLFYSNLSILCHKRKFSEKLCWNRTLQIPFFPWYFY